jgi:hypothetical protein
MSQSDKLQIREGKLRVLWSHQYTLERVRLADLQKWSVWFIWLLDIINSMKRYISSLALVIVALFFPRINFNIIIPNQPWSLMWTLSVRVSTTICMCCFIHAFLSRSPSDLLITFIVVSEIRSHWPFRFYFRCLSMIHCLLSLCGGKSFTMLHATDDRICSVGGHIRICELYRSVHFSSLSSSSSGISSLSVNVIQLFERTAFSEDWRSFTHFF